MSSKRFQHIFGYNTNEMIHSYQDFNGHFILGDLLLKGAQSSIYATATNRTGTTFTKCNRNKSKYTLISKSISIKGEDSEENLEKAVSEYILQRKLNMMHYNGISYDQNQDRILLTMEMLEYTLSDAVDFNLDEQVHDLQCIKTDYGLKYFILEITSFLHRLHSAGFAHLDIKPENIMFRNRKNAQSLFYGNGWKVIDLGLAEYVGSNDNDHINMDCYVGTIGYSAPEIHPFTDSESTSAVSKKADIWSLGMVILYALCGYNIFDVKYDDDRYWKYTQKLYNADYLNSHLMDLYLNNKINFYLYDLLSQILEYEPKKRISAEGIFKHEYFKGMIFCGTDNEFYCRRCEHRYCENPKNKTFVPLTGKIGLKDGE